MYQNVSIVLAHTTLAAVGDYIHIIIMGRVIISNNKNKNDWVKKKKNQIRSKTQTKSFTSHILFIYSSIYLTVTYLVRDPRIHTNRNFFCLYLFIYI